MASLVLMDKIKHILIYSSLTLIISRMYFLFLMQRVCVANCPLTANAPLACKPNSKVTSCSNVNTYPSSPQFERLGGFCGPNS